MTGFSEQPASKDGAVDLMLALIQFFEWLKRLETKGYFFAADGRVECETCGRSYLRHPVDPFDGILHILCSGERVKL